MGGQLSITSTPGAGSCFSFEIRCRLSTVIVSDESESAIVMTDQFATRGMTKTLAGDITTPCPDSSGPAGPVPA